MARLFLIGFVLTLATDALGQSVFFARANVTEVTIARVDADGSNLTDVLSRSSVVDALVAFFPDDTQHDWVALTGIPFFSLDSENRKLYFTGTRTDLATKDSLPVLMRANLDGTDIEVVLSRNVSEVPSGGEFFVDPQVLRSSVIPAVGNVGLAVLLATFVAAGGWVISKRKGFDRPA